jgi:hypothetical protein
MMIGVLLSINSKKYEAGVCQEAQVYCNETSER